MLRRSALFIFVIFALSCAQSPKGIDLSEGSDKLLKFCEEYKYDCLLKQVDRTLWIYLPIDKEIVGVKASQNGPSSSDEFKQSFTVKYLQARFENNQFALDYDIEKSYTYEKEFGYNSVYKDKYQEIQSSMLSIIKNALFDVPKEQAPEFIYFVIADIENGIEVDNLLYFDDFKKAMSTPPTFTQEEYAKRYITNLSGNKVIIGDKTGKHLKYKSFTLPEFLAKQMENRINFKYQRSIFPPSDDVQQEILAQVKETIRAYKFKGFDSIFLNDLRKGNQRTIGRNEL